MKFKLKFSQIFLKKKKIIKKILYFLKLKKKDIILEIGPGLGFLTKKIIKFVKQIHAVEIDKKIIKILKIKFSNYNNFYIYLNNILKFNIYKIYYLNKKKIKIIGNIPYSISTLILFKLIQYKHYIKHQFLMFQKEFVERIIAKKSNKFYNKLSIIMQINYKIKLLFLIKSSNFFPKPKVDSALIYMKPINIINKKKMYILNKILKKIFSKKRKIIFNILKYILCKHDFLKIKINFKKRPSNISINKYIKIINFIKKKYLFNIKRLYKILFFFF